MDAVKFINEYRRIYTLKRCMECPLREKGCSITTQKAKAEEIVDIVEKWSAEHPIKTRQSELLKMFPNAKTNKDGISICPRVVDTKHECERKACEECIKEYWLAEVE